MALQFGEQAARDFASALDGYLKLVDAGGTKNIDELAHDAGLKSPFDDGALKGVCAQIKAHLEKLSGEMQK